MKDNIEHTADELLHQWAKEQGISLRKAGIIDERRERTVRQREVPFTTFFESRKRARGHA